MVYKFKELRADTYQVEDHTIYKDGNGFWIADPIIEKPSLEKAVLNFVNALDNE
jgi:hypothetical protein